MADERYFFVEKEQRDEKRIFSSISQWRVLLFGLWLLDGAFAFTNHGPSMQDVAAVLFAGVGGEGLAGMLAFVGAALLARSRKRELRVA